MTEERKLKLRANQRRMLRYIVATKRLVLQQPVASSASSSSTLDVQNDSVDGQELGNWIDFIIRATHKAEALSSHFHVRDWVHEHFRLKFRLAGHFLRRDDGRWSARVMAFSPRSGSRCRGHPTRRWTDDLDDFFLFAHALRTGEWQQLAHGRETWTSLEEAFCSYRVS